MTEKQIIWKPLNIYPFNEVYEVSNQGDVRRKYKNHYKTINGTPNQNGYIRIHLQYKNHEYYAFAHRLIALTFIENDNPTEKDTVHHINHIKNDNRVVNLQWLSRADNTRESNERRGKAE